MLKTFGRRVFLKSAAGIGLAGSMCGRLEAATVAMKNPVGCATVTWPRTQFADGLQTISDLGFGGVQFLGWVREEFKGPKILELKEKLAGLKLKPVVLSCHGIRPIPDEVAEHTAHLREYAEFFQALGGSFLQVTDGGQPDREYSAQMLKGFGARLNDLGRIAQDYGLTLGYHPHFNNFGGSPAGLGHVLEVTDSRYVKLVADVGHLRLGSSDPVKVIRSHGERLIALHFKDVRRDVADFIKEDPNVLRKRKFRFVFCEVGTGVVDFSGIVRALGEVRFNGWVIVELDGAEPSPGGPGESARKNLEAVRRLGFRV